MISARRACRLVGLSRTVLDYEPKVDPSNAVLEQRLVELAHERRRFGYRRLHALVRREGVIVNEGMRVGRKRVARLMRAARLRGVSRHRGFVVTTKRGPKQRPAPDLVNHQFVPDAPNQLWVADMTYVPTSAGFIFLAIVWSRRIARVL